MPFDLEFTAPGIDRVHCDLLERHAVVLDVLRLDQIHPLINGNKWYKLKNNIEEITSRGVDHVVSFGGAWSNHLYALAAAGKAFGFKTTGIIRGELPDPLNPVLQFVTEQGMDLQFVSRSAYREKEQADFFSRYLPQLADQDFHLLPEGGSNQAAVRGCAEIVSHFPWTNELKESKNIDERSSGLENVAPSRKNRIVALACGTGATAAGIIKGMNSSAMSSQGRVVAVSVLKAPGYLHKQVSSYLEDGANTEAVPWEILENYHCGGYARSSESLRQFIDEFRSISSIPVEPVYSGKLFFALFEEIRQGKIPADTEILAIHSGGTQFLA